MSKGSLMKKVCCICLSVSILSGRCTFKGKTTFTFCFFHWSLECSGQIYLLCSLIFFTGEENKTYPPICTHEEPFIALKRLGKPSCRMSGFILSNLQIRFNLLTSFHPNPAHTIEAIVVFPAAKSNCKVILNECHVSHLLHCCNTLKSCGHGDREAGHAAC